MAFPKHCHTYFFYTNSQVKAVTVYANYAKKCSQAACCLDNDESQLKNSQIINSPFSHVGTLKLPSNNLDCGRSLAQQLGRSCSSRSTGPPEQAHALLNAVILHRKGPGTCACETPTVLQEGSTVQVSHLACQSGSFKQTPSLSMPLNQICF